MIILLNGKELILSDNSLEINSANPFLSNDEERIDNIFSLEIPITGNEVALNYANNIDAIVGNEFTCEIISSINFFGVAIITEVSNNNNSATIQIGYSKSNFNYLIKDKKLKEFDFGEIACADKVKMESLSGIPSLHSHIGDVYRYLLNFHWVSGNYNYVSEDWNVIFFKSTEIKVNLGIQFDQWLNRTVKIKYQKNNGSLVEVFSLYIDTNVTDHLELLTFSVTGQVGDIVKIYIDIVCEYSTVGFWLDSAFLDCTILDKDFVYEANTNNNSNYCFPMIGNIEMAKNLPDSPDKNYYNEKMPFMNNITSNDRSFSFNFGQTYTKILAPCLRVNYMLSQVFSQCGYKLDKSEFDSIYKNLVVLSTNIIGEYKSTNSLFYIDIPTTFKLNKCFENDILTSDLLKDIFVITGFFPVFNHEAKTVKLVSIANIFNKVTKVNMIIIDDTINYNNEDKGISIEIDTGEDTYLKDNYNNLEDYNFKGNITTLSDVPEDAELNDCYYITSERKYYAYYFGKVNDQATTNTLFWKFVSNDYRLEEEQGKENYVEFKSETPIMVGTTAKIGVLSVYNNLNIPVTSQPIRIDKAYDTYESNYSNSFLIVRGFKTKDGLGEYLYASADTYFGQTQENGISLRVDADNGIMNRMYKNLIRIYSQGKRHSISGYMKTDEIKKLTYENLIEVDNSVNLLLSYSYTLRDSEYMDVELELIKI